MILIVDLNNFAKYPTASVGLIAAICRKAGERVSVFSPLFMGVEGITREKPVSNWSLFLESMNFWSAQTRFRTVRHARSWVGRNLRSPLSRSSREVLRTFAATLERSKPKVVLVSAYLMYKDLVARLSAICSERGVPVLLGGPYFSQPEVNQQWLSIPGVTALVAGEVDFRIPDVVGIMSRNEDPTVVPGIMTRDATGAVRGTIADPLDDLSGLPIPDFSDFPWQLGAQRIVPVVTGRGCGWGVCTFCSDVTSTAGRTFRSRPLSEVLLEIRHQHDQLGVELFVFTDLKLNSNLDMWRGVIAGMQDAAPGAKWIASVHCAKGENGLTRGELQAAAAAGCVRLTTGLESGSQRVLDSMRKGTRLERLAEYFRDVAQAGISARATMIIDYPGETPEDIDRSASFVQEQAAHIERIKLCNFSMIVGTAIDRQRLDDPTSLPLNDFTTNLTQAQVDYRVIRDGHARRHAAVRRLLRAVHDVNRKSLLERAQPFQGVM